MGGDANYCEFYGNTIHDHLACGIYVIRNNNVIYGNTFYSIGDATSDAGVRLHKEFADNNVVCRNTFYNNAGMGLDIPAGVDDDGDDNYISQNIFYKNNFTGSYMSGTGNIVYYSTSVSNIGNGIQWRFNSSEIRNTLTAGNTGFGYANANNNDNIDYCGSYGEDAENDVVNNGDLLNQPNCMITNPFFVNPSTDFHLKWNSPFQGAGENGSSMGRYSTRVIPAVNAAGATTSYDFIFATTYIGSIPANGVIYLKFPSGFSFTAPAATTTSSWGGGAGTFSVDVSGTTLIITRNNDGNPSTAGAVENLNITGINNPGAGADNYRLEWWTEDSSGNLIDWPEESNEFRIIGCPMPTITSFTSTNACQGDTLTIKGSGFSNTGTVWIQDIAIAPGNISTWNGSQIQIIAIPAGITNGVIKISNTCGQVGYSISNFKTPGTMSITGFSPSSGCEGDTITIYGAGFGHVQDNGGGTPGSIWIDSWDATASNIYWSDSMIQIIMGPAEPSGLIYVTNYCGNGTTSAPSNLGGCPIARMIVTKTVISPAGLPLPGDLVTYRIDWTNAGTGNGVDVKITDTIPNNTSYSLGTMSNGSGPLTDGWDSDAGATNGNTIVFCPGTNIAAPDNGGAVNPGDSGEFYFSVIVQSSAGQTNYVTNIIFEDDFEDGNFDGWVDVNVVMAGFGLDGSTDCVQIGSGDNSSIRYSQNLTGYANIYLKWTWRHELANNAGDNSIMGYATNDNTPPAVVVTGAPFGETTETVAIPSWADGHIDFDFRFFHNNAGGGTEYTYVDNVKLFSVDVVPPGEPPDSITNEVCVSGSNFNQICTNLVTDVLSDVPNVVITKSIVSPTGKPLPGEYIKYRIHYQNLGTVDASNVLITDILPNGTVYSQGSMSNHFFTGYLTDEAGDDSGATNNGGTELVFAATNGFASGTGGIIPVAESGSMYFKVRVTAAGGTSITNELYATGDNFTSSTSSLVTMVSQPLVSCTGRTIIIYVDDTSPGPATPYSNINIAALTIQHAVDYIYTNNCMNADLTATSNKVFIYVLNGQYTETVIVNGYITSDTYDITIMNYSNHAPEITGLNLVNQDIVRLRDPFTTFQGIYIHDNIINGAPNRAILADTSNCIVKKCQVYNIQGDAPTYGAIGSDGNNNLIISNIVHDIANPADVHGMGIQCYGSNNRITGNTVYDCKRFPIRTGLGTGSWISHNHIYDTKYSGALIRISTGSNYKIFNNIIGPGGSSGIWVVPGSGADNSSIYNNTFYNLSADGIEYSDDSSGVSIFNNIISHCSGIGINVTGAVTYSAVGVDYNLCYSNNGAQSGVSSWGANNITNNIDPQYVSTNIGSADFMKLQSTSTCIDRGMNAVAYNLTNDYWGSMRPFDDSLHFNYDGGTYYDIGAFESFVSDITLHHFTITHDSNANNCGTFNDFGTYITYTFNDCENGILTLYINDDTAESIDIEARSANITTATDTDLEGPLYFATTGATISLNKFISNVRLGGTLISGIAPGSTITFTISYSNQGPAAANNFIIRDALQGNVKYLEMLDSGSWTNQYTSINPPDQSWGSTDYSNAQAGPFVDDSIAWVRWKIPTIAPGSTGLLTYKVIVK